MAWGGAWQWQGTRYLLFQPDALFGPHDFQMAGPRFCWELGFNSLSELWNV